MFCPVQDTALTTIIDPDDGSASLHLAMNVVGLIFSKISWRGSQWRIECLFSAHELPVDCEEKGVYSSYMFILECRGCYTCHRLDIKTLRCETAHNYSNLGLGNKRYSFFIVGNHLCPLIRQNA